MNLCRCLFVMGSVVTFLACGTDESREYTSVSPGTGGSNVEGGSGGTAGSATGGTAGSATGGTGGSATGGTGGSATGGTGGTSGVMGECKANGYTDPSCGTCMESQCANECKACLTNVNCEGFLACLIQNNCSTIACQNDCLNQHPGGDTLLNAWMDTCLLSNCATPCNAGTNCGLTVSDPDCDDCFNAHCFNECKSFADDPNWETWLQCVGACTTTACENNCDTQNPTAASKGKAFLNCQAYQCHEPCGIGCGLTVGNTVCDDCFNANCFVECKTFADDPNWNLWLTCFNGCSTSTCQSNCNTQYPQASSRGLAFFDCIDVKCAQACN